MRRHTSIASLPTLPMTGASFCSDTQPYFGFAPSDSRVGPRPRSLKARSDLGWYITRLWRSSLLQAQLHEEERAGSS